MNNPMAESNNNQKQPNYNAYVDRSAQKMRNRVRLMAMFSFYPIWKMYDAYEKNDMAMTVILGLSSIGYLMVVMLLFARTRG